MRKLAISTPCVKTRKVVNRLFFMRFQLSFLEVSGDRYESNGAKIKILRLKIKDLEKMGVTTAR